MTEDAATPLHPPPLEGRYRFDHMIGTTASASVWLGWDERLLRPVRLHVLNDAALLPGALATARIHHPALLATVDVCHQPAVMVTEHLLGTPLMDERRRWSWPEAAEVIDPVGEALAVLHDAGLAHGSLSGSSVELDRDGRVVVIDCVAVPDPDGSLARADVASLDRLLAVMVTGVVDDVTGMVEALELVQPSPPDELVSMLSAGLAPEGQGQGPSDAGEWTRRLRALPVPQGGMEVAATDDGPVDFVRSERAWFIPALLVVTVGLVLAVVGFAGGGTPVGRRIIEGAREAVGLQPSPTTELTAPASTATTPPVPGDAVPIAAIVDFDPEGDFDEHADRLRLVNDGDAAEGWYTENYTTRDFGGLKQGVGLIVRLQEPVDLSSVRVESPNTGWSVEIYTSMGGLPDDLAAWGEATGTADDIDGDATIDTGGAEASAFLVWVTDLGDPTSDGHRLTITAVEATAQS